MDLKNTSFSLELKTGAHSGAYPVNIHAIINLWIYLFKSEFTATSKVICMIWEVKSLETFIVILQACIELCLLGSIIKETRPPWDRFCTQSVFANCIVLWLSWFDLAAPIYNFQNSDDRVPSVPEWLVH